MLKFILSLIPFFFFLGGMFIGDYKGYNRGVEIAYKENCEQPLP